MKALKEDIVIDQAEPRDLPDVLDLWAELMVFTANYNSHYGLVENSKRVQESYMKAFFDSNTATIFVARDAGRIVAFTNVYITKPAPVFEPHVLGVIENIYVRPEYRRRHIGLKLVERSHQYFTDFGADEIYVNVIPANGLSEKFWYAMGYRTQKLTMAKPGK